MVLVLLCSEPFVLSVMLVFVGSRFLPKVVVFTCPSRE